MVRHRIHKDSTSPSTESSKTGPTGSKVSETLQTLKKRTHCIRREARELLQSYRAERRNAKSKPDPDTKAPVPPIPQPAETASTPQEKFKRLLSNYEQSYSVEELSAPIPDNEVGAAQSAQPDVSSATETPSEKSPFRPPIMVGLANTGSEPAVEIAMDLPMSPEDVAGQETAANTCDTPETSDKEDTAGDALKAEPDYEQLSNPEAEEVTPEAAPETECSIPEGQPVSADADGSDLVDEAEPAHGDDSRSETLDLSKIAVPDLTTDDVPVQPESTAESSPPDLEQSAAETVNEPAPRISDGDSASHIAKPEISHRWEQIRVQQERVRRMAEAANAKNAMHNADVKSRAAPRARRPQPSVVSKTPSNPDVKREDRLSRRRMRGRRTTLKSSPAAALPTETAPPPPPTDKSSITVRASRTRRSADRNALNPASLAPPVPERGIAVTSPDSAELERLSQVGAGMRLRLEQIGIMTVADLAHADPDTVKVKLGVVSRLANVEAWIAEAKTLLAELSPQATVTGQTR